MARGLTLYRRPAPATGRSLLEPSWLFDELVSGWNRPPRVADRRERFTPRVEALERETEYRLVAEMPGVEASDFEVHVEDDVLTLKGERQWESEGDDASATTTSFERRFRFGSEIAADDIKAAYKNGILTVTVPKREEPTPESVTIPIECA